MSLGSPTGVQLLDFPHKNRFSAGDHSHFPATHPVLFEFDAHIAATVAIIR